MPPSQVAGIAVNECPGCHGLWVSGDHFDALVKRAAQSARAARTRGRGRRASPRGNPLAAHVRYRRCPECDQFMLRTNYKRSSGVILDECRAHGTWLDADELEQVAGFILAGGRTSPMLEHEHTARGAPGGGGVLARAGRASASTSTRTARHIIAACSTCS